VQLTIKGPFIRIIRLTTCYCGFEIMASNRASSGPVYTVCATVTTGLEPGALEECREIFGPSTQGRKTRGKIFFELDSLKDVQQV